VVKKERKMEKENRREGDFCTKIHSLRYSPLLDTDTLDIMLKEAYNF